MTLRGPYLGEVREEKKGKRRVGIKEIRDGKGGTYLSTIGPTKSRTTRLRKKEEKEEVSVAALGGGKRRGEGRGRGK